MIKNTLLLFFTITALTSPGQSITLTFPGNGPALTFPGQGSIDAFVNTRCANRCNGEKTDCWNCYSQGLDLWHNAFTNPETDPNSDSDDDDPYGNVGFMFS